MNKKDQLTLLEPPNRQWRLDRATREAGRKGLEQARRALADAARRKAA